jgi:hypothetical protein
MGNDAAGLKFTLPARARPEKYSGKHALANAVSS